MQQTRPDLPPVLRLTQLLRVVPMSRSSIWARVQAGESPKPFKLGPKTTVWKTDDVLNWIDDRARERSAS